MLLKTKLYIPPPRPEFVPRPRLFERLNAGQNRKLTLISAPAGFGKSTLLSSWATVSDIPTAWLTLDSEDNDPNRFLIYLGAALRSLEPECTEPTQDQHAAVSQEKILTGIINRTSEITQPFALILDDYHLIEANAVYEALNFLIEHMPPQMHLYIATRADPVLPLSRLRGRDQLVEIRAADLSFTYQEAEDFLHRVVEPDLPAKAVRSLAQRTEGWVTGLQMAALALRGPISARQNVSDFIDAFTGSHEYIVDYLTDEVLKGLSEDVRAFLIQTSILERLCGPLCDALTGRRDGHEMLENLREANLFTLPLDYERRWYRYHHLFAELLCYRLKQTYPEHIADLHRRASTWYTENTLPFESIRHTLAAGDFQEAARQIEENAQKILVRGQYTTFEGWVKALPEESLKERPLLNAYYASALILGGHSAETIQSHLQNARQGNPGRLAQGIYAVLRSLFAAYRGNIAQFIELSERALALLPEEDPLFRNAAFRNIGIAYLLNGQTDAAEKTLLEADQTNDESENLVGAVMNKTRLASVLNIQGRLKEARELYERALELADDEDDKPLSITGIVNVGLGAIFYELNELEKATPLLVEGIRIAEGLSEVWTIGGHLFLANVRQAQGFPQDADVAVQRAEHLAQMFDASELDDLMVDLYKVRFWLNRGDIETAASWAENRPQLYKDLPRLPYLEETEQMLLARIAIVQGDRAKALDMLKTLRDSAQKCGRMGIVLQILALQALAEDDIEDALDALQQALTLGEPEGYMRSFIDLGPSMAKLLYEAAARGIAPEYAGRLLAAFPEMPVPQTQTQPEKMIEPLSDRELEILRLIAQGLSNQKIANRLYLSLSTVKWHTSNIYGKLNASNRTHAVARAKEIGILASD